MSTAHCFMVVSSYTLLIRRAPMENSGMLSSSLAFLFSLQEFRWKFIIKITKSLSWWITLWTTSVLYEVFPMSFLMEQAGGQAFTGKQRVLTWAFVLLFPIQMVKQLTIYLSSNIKNNSHTKVSPGFSEILVPLVLKFCKKW